VAEKKLVVNLAWCTGCGICAAFCPRKILEVEYFKVVVTDSGQCAYCGQCELRCPDYAIHIDAGEEGGWQ